jgi:hypothetical protein
LTITVDVPANPVSSRAQFEGNKAWLQYEINALPRIAELARMGRFELCINTEVDFELAWLPPVIPELSVFNGLCLRRIPDPFFYGRIVASPYLACKELDDLRQKIFAARFDERFNKIKQAAGGNKNADAFHILSAERAGVEYFVTADKRLINSLRNQRRVQLGVKVVFPSELLHHACDWPLNPDRDWRSSALELRQPKAAR